MTVRDNHLAVARRRLGKVEVELCPFCGKLPQLIGVDGNGSAYIQCRNWQGVNMSGCGVEMRYPMPSCWPRKCKNMIDLYTHIMTLCLKKWNRRAKPLTKR
jgi:hypothetical protein